MAVSSSEYYRQNREKIYARRRELRRTSLVSKLRSLLNNAKLRRECTISLDELLALYEKQKGKCALSGMDMTLADGETRTRTMAVSLDRIDNTKDYEIDNVQLVAARINYMRGALTTSEFKDMCRKVADHG